MTDFIVYRLKEANWISGHRFEKDRGYTLEWTSEGRQKAMLLQDLVNRHQLTEESRARGFSLITSSDERTPWGSPVPVIERDFWQVCLEELQIGVEETALATLSRVIACWEHP